MSVTRLRDDRLDCGALESRTPWLRTVVVGPGGTPSMLPVESARFEVANPAPTESATGPTSAAFALFGTLDERTAHQIGDPVTGAGVSALLDIRGYTAVRVQPTTAQAGRIAAVTIVASSARPGTP